MNIKHLKTIKLFGVKISKNYELAPHAVASGMRTVAGNIVANIAKYIETTIKL